MAGRGNAYCAAGAAYGRSGGALLSLPPSYRVAPRASSHLALLAVVSSVLAAPALAHVGPPPLPGTLLGAWSLEPWVVGPIAAMVLLYVRGLTALWRRAGRGRGIRRSEAACFAAGILALLVALVSPLDALGSALFSAHMAQHMVLVIVAAPLLVLGRPLVAMVWAMPRGWRERAGRIARLPPVARGWAAFTAPLAVWALHGAALWVWHAPGLYQATLTTEWVHVLQHISFFGSGVLFWWVLLRNGLRPRLGPGVGVLVLFTTAVHTSLLGALLTFSGTGWYPAYEVTAWWWGLTLLEDQQIGGLIMWVPGGLAYLLAALALLGVWMRRAERRSATGSVPERGSAGAAPA